MYTIKASPRTKRGRDNLIKISFKNWLDLILNDKIKNMGRFIKKWWLLENLRKEINRHSEKQSLEEVSTGRVVLLSKRFFIAGRKDLPEYPGLAEKSFWRKGWFKKKYSDNELKRRIQEYNDIFDVCVKEDYIEMTQTSKGFMPSIATPKADKISGVFGLLEGILSEYKSVWTMVIIPIIAFLIGLLI